MEGKSKPDDKMARIVFGLLVILSTIILGSLVYALSFSSTPTINDGNSEIYTTDNLVCSWAVSADTISTNVSWYKNGVIFSSDIISDNSSTIDNSLTTKYENWTCSVNINNGTNDLQENITSSIKNSKPADPNLIYNGLPAAQFFNLVEDVEYNFTINSTDPDGDILNYILVEDAGLCSVLNSSSGLINCLATHQDISGTASPAAEDVVNKLIDMLAKEANIYPYASAGDLFNFTLIPINDQAYFTQNISTQIIQAGSAWSVVTNAEDEEANYPLNFTLWSDLNNITAGLIIITSTSNKTASITFSEQTTNNHAGNWTVVINVTDSYGFNSSRIQNQINFSLRINITNFAPTFITNFSEISSQNWTQGDSLSIILNANDSNIDDILNFSIVTPTNTSLRCTATFPWIVTTTNNSYLNASALINVVNLTNDYVACRYVNLIVSDQVNGANSQSDYLINIININDAPVMNEMGIDGNITNKSTRLFQRFIYRINVTDPDSLTYDSNNTANLSYYSNDSRFQVDRSLGIMNFTITNESDIGNWSILLTVSDGFLNDSKLMEFNVLNNSAPLINLYQNNFNVLQNSVDAINFSVLEMDNESTNLSFNSLTSMPDSVYQNNFSLLNHNYSNGTNLENWILNLSRSSNKLRNDLVGNHQLNLVFQDSAGGSLENYSTGLLNFTIINENDAPFFDNNQDNVSNSIIFGQIVMNISYSILINVTDFDLFLGSLVNESLTFNYSNPSVDLTNISFVKVDESSNSAVLNFTSTTNGTKSINLTVVDSSGYNESVIVEFTVLANSIDPIFQLIKPYFNLTTNSTINNFTDATSYATHITNINVSENTTIIFDASVTNDTSIVGNSLTFKWYVDNVLNNTITSVTPTINSNFSKYFNLFSNGTHNITLEAIDSRYASSRWTWIVNVSNVNRPPIYCNNTIEDLSINGTSTISDYLSYRNSVQRFYDPDDDLTNDGENAPLNCSTYRIVNLSSLSYSVYETAPCEIATFAFIGSDIIIDPSLEGVCRIQFIASDNSSLNATSNVVNIVLVGADPSDGTDTPSRSSGGSSTTTQIITVPVDLEVDKPVPIKLIAPGVVTTYANKTMYIPLRLKNTWTEDIRGIELSGVSINATMVGEDNITLRFDQQYFPSIVMGAEAITTVEISNYRKEGPFEIVIYAKVESPSFTDSASILISSLEQTSIGDQIKSKVTFAKDMISENPVCRELNDLLDRAENEANLENYAEAMNLVDGVINGCKYLNEEEQSRRETQSIVKKGFDLSVMYSKEIILGALLILVITLIFYVAAALRRRILDK
ncbi:MAG: hypothetical protein WC758_02315 [Candidatus Woesearchaeota archaeon]|jgi:hypothetical protein